jgi:hypothetical protein
MNFKFQFTPSVFYLFWEDNLKSEIWNLKLRKGFQFKILELWHLTLK